MSYILPPPQLTPHTTTSWPSPGWPPQRSLELILKSYPLQTKENASFNDNMDSLAKVVENADYESRRAILGKLEDMGGFLKLSPVGLRNPMRHELATDCTGNEGHFTRNILQNWILQDGTV